MTTPTEARQLIEEMRAQAEECAIEQSLTAFVSRNGEHTLEGAGEALRAGVAALEAFLPTDETEPVEWHDYTPTTARVRWCATRADAWLAYSPESFDRWLTSVTREAQEATT